MDIIYIPHNSMSNNLCVIVLFTSENQAFIIGVEANKIYNICAQFLPYDNTRPTSIL